MGMWRTVSCLVMVVALVSVALPVVRNDDSSEETPLAKAASADKARPHIRSPGLGVVVCPEGICYVVNAWGPGQDDWSFWKDLSKEKIATNSSDEPTLQFYTAEQVPF